MPQMKFSEDTALCKAVPAPHSARQSNREISMQKAYGFPVWTRVRSPPGPQKKAEGQTIEIDSVAVLPSFFVLLSSEMGGLEFRTSIFIFTVAIRKRPCVRKTNNY